MRSRYVIAVAPTSPLLGKAKCTISINVWSSKFDIPFKSSSRTNVPAELNSRVSAGDVKTSAPTWLVDSVDQSWPSSDSDCQVFDT